MLIGTDLGKLQIFLFLCIFPDVHGLQWSKLHVHADFKLKPAYGNKQVFFREFLGSSKYNASKRGPKSMQRDMGSHKSVIYQVW